MFGSLDKDVMYILAVHNFETNVGVLGMPAYDQHKKLLGFYRDEQGADGVTRTVMKGTPLPLSPTSLSDTLPPTSLSVIPPPLPPTPPTALSLTLS